MRKPVDLTGLTFGRLTVLEKDKTKSKSYWICKCNCPRKKIVSIYYYSLVKGISTSCGCFREEKTSKEKKKYNEYIFHDDYVEIILSNSSKRASIDLEDYEKIKNYCWAINGKGYAVSHRKNSRGSVFLHNIILDIANPRENEEPDHEDKNPLNCRKYNLRMSTHAENSRNRGRQKNNKSGITGVYFVTRLQRWAAAIEKDGKKYLLGHYKIFEDAVRVRLLAEKEYFGEFAPQKHLFQKYGIE